MDSSVHPATRAPGHQASGVCRQSVNLADHVLVNSSWDSLQVHWGDSCSDLRS